MAKLIDKDGGVADTLLWTIAASALGAVFGASTGFIGNACAGPKIEDFDFVTYGAIGGVLYCAANLLLQGTLGGFIERVVGAVPDRILLIIFWSAAALELESLVMGIVAGFVNGLVHGDVLLRTIYGTITLAIGGSILGIVLGVGGGIVLLLIRGLSPRFRCARLNQQTSILYDQGRYNEALPLATHAHDLALRRLGKDNPEFARSLNLLGLLYTATGDYAKAEQQVTYAMDVVSKVFGKSGEEYAASLNNLGSLYATTGKHEKAERLLQQAAGILETNKADDLLLTKCLHTLAAVYLATGNYKSAKSISERALDIRRKLFGERDPLYAVSLQNLASVYMAIGENAAAIPLLEQAIEIQREAGRDSHPDFAHTLRNLGVALFEIGNYAKAESLFRETLELERRLLGEDHPQHAMSMNVIGELYSTLGDFSKAEPLLEGALKIRRRALGPEHGDVATSLNNLAKMYSARRQHKEAEPLLREALKIRRRAIGEEHGLFAQSLNNLAVNQTALGNLDAAEPLHQQAMRIRREVYGENHSEVANSQRNLGTLRYSRGDHRAAEPYFRQVLEIYEKTRNQDHPELVPSLVFLAAICAATDRSAEALGLMKRAAVIEDAQIEQVFSISSERRRMAYLAHIRVNFEVFLSLVLTQLHDSRDARLAAFDLVLRRKAIVAEAMRIEQEVVLSGRYPSQRATLDRLRSLRQQISRKTMAGPGQQSWNAHQQQLAEWHRDKQELESELARQIPEFGLERELRDADRFKTAAALPPKSVLVEIVRTNVVNFHVPEAAENRWQPARYLAFVLPAGEPDNVQLVDLREADPIDEMSATFRTSIGGGERFGRPAPPSADPAAVESNGSKLRAAVFDPLVPTLGGRTQLFFAPDGDLSVLPIGALPTGEGECIIDRYEIHYLSVGREVVGFNKSRRQSTKPVVAADPDFNLGGGRSASRETAAPDARRTRYVDLGQFSFSPLPYTREEGEQIGQLLEVKPWFGPEVLTTRLKKVRSPLVLHLATHGFFAEPRQPAASRAGVLTIPGILGGFENGEFSESIIDNPLLRSGLALAGANGKSGGFTPPAQAEDGVLLAEDVASMDLFGTELVVLSACATGLGKVHEGEGVFGLRRAFALAGAKSLVMSLWNVPDKQTQELMVEFYRRVLRGDPRATALREAQLAIRRVHPEQFYWGAFIYQGDPGPLSRQAY